MSFVSYAQNGEDVLLHRVFGGQGTGFYVDVGAYHPVEGSVTKAFYDRGWAGINIEPGQIFDDLAAARPRDVNLRMAVLDRTGMVAFNQNQADAGLSLVTEDQAPGSIQVPCDTLENIVRLHSGGRPVDFLKVDAEGAEAAIVGSTDWRRFRPRVLVFEATLPWSATLSNAEWEPALLEGGYVRAYFDGINCYYLPEEEEPILGRHFKVPVNVLDSVQRYDVVVQREAAQARIAALEAQCLEAHTALENSRAEVGRIRAAAQAEQAEAQSRSAAMQAEFSACLAVSQAESDARLAELQADRDGLVVALEACRAERDEFRAWLPAPEAQAVAAPTPMAGPPVAKGRPLRRMVRFAYSLFRPFVRPVTHRFRTFMMVPQLEAFESLRRDLAAGRLQISQAAHQLASPCGPSGVEVVTTSADLAEMRRLAAEMERTILTLALEGEGSSVQYPAEPASSAACGREAGRG